MILRKLTADDAPAFRKLREEAIDNSPFSFVHTQAELRAFTDSDIANWISPSPDRFSIGAFDGSDNLLGNLLGFAGLYREGREKVKHVGTIWGVFVSTTARRQGIGRRLIEMVLNEARNITDLEQVNLSVVLTETPALSLYISLGFIPFGTKPKATKINGIYQDELMLWRPLPISQITNLRSKEK